MAEPPSPSPYHYNPETDKQYTQQSQIEQERIIDVSQVISMEDASLDSEPQEQVEVTHPQSTNFTTPGFTSYSHQAQPQILQSSLSIESIQKMLQELYKAMTEKMVTENAAMFAALKAESAKVKKELEDLRNEVESTYLSKKVLQGIDTCYTSSSKATVNITPNIPTATKDTLPPISQPIVIASQIPLRPSFTNKYIPSIPTIY